MTNDECHILLSTLRFSGLSVGWNNEFGPSRVEQLLCLCAGHIRDPLPADHLRNFMQAISPFHRSDFGFGLVSAHFLANGQMPLGVTCNLRKMRDAQNLVV